MLTAAQRTEPITIIESGIVYRNPKPYLRAIHTWHPSIAQLADGTLVACFDLGQAVEALDYRTYCSRSIDGGRTWSEPRRVIAADHPTAPHLSTHSLRISRPGNSGELVGFGEFYYRDNPEQGQVNRDNLGIVPTQLFLVRSHDGGVTWQPPELIEAPLVGPGFEICHAIVELTDGRWLAPTSTWRGWHGDQPNGTKAIALVSEDRGRTWPYSIDVMDHTHRQVITWEQSLVQMGDGRLVSVAWLFDEKTSRTEPTQYAVSLDGRSFEPSRLNGLRGQTAKLLRLPDDRLLCLYRRDDKPGMWAHVARVQGQEWIGIGDTVLWTGAASGMTGQGNSSDELSALRFGFPSMTLLPDGQIMALIWCEEDSVNNIRWFRIKV